MKNLKGDFIAACCSAIAISLALLGPLTAQADPPQGSRAPAAGTVYEGEALAISGKILVSGGKVAPQPMSGFGQGWSGNAQLLWTGGQPGAVLDLLLDVPVRAVYAVELHMTRAPDFGRLRIQVDGKDVAATFDGYGPAVVPSGPFAVGSFDLGPGPRKVSFMIVGKHGNATGFLAGIDFIRLSRPAPAQTAQGPASSASTAVTPSSDSGAKIDQGLVRVVPARAVARRTDRSLQIQPRPKPLSLADKQQTVKSLLISLEQQNIANPGLNLSKWFPSSATPISLKPSSTVLSPKDWWIDNVACLLFSNATRLGAEPGDQDFAAYLWDSDDPTLKSSVRLSLKASEGQTYLLDYTLLQATVSLTDPKFKPGKMDVLIWSPGASEVDMEMSVTSGHILVPFLASTAGWYVIDVACKTPWKFYSVQVSALSDSSQ